MSLLFLTHLTTSFVPPRSPYSSDHNYCLCPWSSSSLILAPTRTATTRIRSLRWNPLHLHAAADSDRHGHRDLHHEMPAVLGLGQAMVDFSGMVEDEFLEKLGLEKGTRKVVSLEERGRVLRAMDGCSYKAAAGGSLSNTLVALARLDHSISVSMAGIIGSDPLGGFFRTKLARANVRFVSEEEQDSSTTGTVIVLTTPDAQRTMLSYLPDSSSRIQLDPAIISKTTILVVEGYLLENPHNAAVIKTACQEASRVGALVAVTTSDVSCVQSHYNHFRDITGNYAHLVFANSSEARALSGFSNDSSPDSVTRELSRFVPVVSVTDGARGSYVGVKGQAVYIPPSPCVPVDSCGAGDAYASGILYGLLRGSSDLKEIGDLAARIAATVVGQRGTRLSVRDATNLAESFAFNMHTSSNT